ncbi:hypothetical protein Tco_0631816 [Tanacetum coccineum]
MAEFLRLPDFHGCKVFAGELLPPGSARVTHLTTPAERVEDIPPKTGDMMVAELPCQKVLDDKERKKRKVQPTSEHVSSPTPLNHAEPLTTIAGEAHVTPPTSAGRTGILRDQTDEPVTPPVVNIGEFPTGREDGQDGTDAMFANEGHGNNEGGLSGLQTQPSLARPADRLLETVEKPASDKIIPDAEWGLKESSRMDNSRQRRDMMSNLFTPADLEIFNEGCRMADRIKHLEEASKQSEVEAQQLRFDKEKYAVEAGQGEMGFIDGISIGRKEEDIRAILKATPKVDPSSLDTFMETYEKLFEKRYPYVDKSIVSPGHGYWPHNRLSIPIDPEIGQRGGKRAIRHIHHIWKKN